MVIDDKAVLESTFKVP